MLDLQEGILEEFSERQALAPVLLSVPRYLRVTRPQAPSSYWVERRAEAAKLRPKRKPPKSIEERRATYWAKHKEEINAARRAKRASAPSVTSGRSSVTPEGPSVTSGRNT